MLLREIAVAAGAKTDRGQVADQISKTKAKTSTPRVAVITRNKTAAILRSSVRLGHERQCGCWKTFRDTRVRQRLGTRFQSLDDILDS